MTRVVWKPTKTQYKLLKNANRLLDEEVVLRKSDGKLWFQELEYGNRAKLHYAIPKKECIMFDNEDAKAGIYLNKFLDSLEKGEENEIIFDDKLIVKNKFKYELVPVEEDDNEVVEHNLEFTAEFDIPYHDLYEVGKRFSDISTDIKFTINEKSVTISSGSEGRTISSTYDMVKPFQKMFKNNYDIEYVRAFHYYSLRDIDVTVKMAEDNPALFMTPYTKFLLAPMVM